jgi:hypothetical protein
MTDADAIDFFESQTVAAVRALSLVDARRYLRGLLLVADSSELGELRQAYAYLCSTDDQLELISRQQLKFVCAWCEPGRNNDPSVTHGICSKCRAKLESELQGGSPK